MKHMEYEKPEAETLDVAVERGFAGSGETQLEAQAEGFDRGDWNE